MFELLYFNCKIVSAFCWVCPIQLLNKQDMNRIKMGMFYIRQTWVGAMDTI